MAFLYVAKRSMVFHSARLLAKGFFLQLHCHEHLLWHLVLAVNTEARSGREAKSGIILRMPQNNDGNKAQLLALLKTLPVLLRLELSWTFAGSANHHDLTKMVGIMIRDYQGFTEHRLAIPVRDLNKQICARIQDILLHCLQVYQKR